MDDPDTTSRPRAAAARDHARAAMSDRLAGLWWTFILRGLLAAALGVAALFWPTGSISTLLQLVGIFLIIDGVLTFFGSGYDRTAGVAGLGAAAIGLILLIWPEGTARLAFFLIGAWALITGIGSLMTWRRMPEDDPERATARSVGIFAILVGLVLIFWPGSGVVALGWAIAFAALAVAAAMFWLASRFKRANDRLKARAGQS